MVHRAALQTPISIGTLKQSAFACVLQTARIQKCFPSLSPGVHNSQFTRIISLTPHPGGEHRQAHHRVYEKLLLRL